MLNNQGVIEIVLYFNGVLHETNFAFRCEHVIDLCVRQTNL